MPSCGASLRHLSPEHRGASCSMKESHSKEVSCGEDVHHKKHNDHRDGRDGGYGGSWGGMGWGLLVWFFILFLLAWFVLWAVRPESAQKKDSKGYATGEVDGGKILVGALLIALIVIFVVAIVFWAVAGSAWSSGASGASAGWGEGHSHSHGGYSRSNSQSGWY